MTLQTACQISLSLANMLQGTQNISLRSPLSTDTIIQDANGVIWVTDWFAQDIAGKSAMTRRSTLPSLAQKIPRTTKIAPDAMKEPIALHVYGRPVSVAPELLCFHTDSAGLEPEQTVAWKASIYSLGVLMYTLFTAVGGKPTYPQFVGTPDEREGTYLDACWYLACV